MATVFEDRYGISMPEWKVLAIIAGKPGLSAVSVARLAQMDTVAVSRAVTKLMDRGLIDRELDSEDRRRSVLDLSETGKQLHAEIVPLAMELEASLMEDFSEEERNALAKAIRFLDAKSRDFTDACSAPPQRQFVQARAGNAQLIQNRFRPRQPGPLLEPRLNGTSGSLR
jgi:DNA-binding MarR family transcriptional regulator